MESLSPRSGQIIEAKSPTRGDGWQHEALVVDKWFALQAASPRPDTLARVRELMSHPAFTIRNPNKVRAVIGAFCQGNHVRFNAADGSGYAFAADASDADTLVFRRREE